jgi:hypothetical protein
MKSMNDIPGKEEGYERSEGERTDGGVNRRISADITREERRRDGNFFLGRRKNENFSRTIRPERVRVPFVASKRFR